MNGCPLVLKCLMLAAVLLLQACQDKPSKSELPLDSTPLGLSVQAPVVREPVAGRDITVAYLTIHNQGDEERLLRGVSSPYASRIEIHEHQHNNGRMRMVKLSSLPIAANSDTVLQSGGAHLMLFNLKPSYTLKADGDHPPEAQTVQLTLLFDQDETLTVSTQLSSVLN